MIPYTYQRIKADSLLIIALLLFFSNIQQALSQNIDSSYIYLFPSNNQIRTGLRYSDVEIRFFSDSKEAFVFNSSNLGVSIGGRIGKIGLGITLPVSDLGTSEANASNIFDFNLQFYRPRYLFQLTGRQIFGFQTEEVFRNDIKLWDLTLYGFKVFNPRLSLRAAFKNNERQKINQGSWLAALSLNTQVLLSDSLSLPGATDDNFIIDRYQQFELGFGVGYAYTLVLPKNWYISPVLVVGPEIRYLRYRGFASDNSRERLRLSPRFRGRIAIGHNGDRFFFSVASFLLPGIATSKRLNTRVQDNLIRFRIGLRW